MSRATLGAVLRIDENSFDKFDWYEFSKTIHLRGERRQWLTIARHVDELFVGARWFCPDCVEHIVCCIYSRIVTFDPANDGNGLASKFNVVRFLDLWCVMIWQEVFSPL